MSHDLSPCDIEPGSLPARVIVSKTIENRKVVKVHVALWQEMDDAPRDNALILLVERDGTMKIGCWVGIDYDGFETWDDQYGYRVEAVRWMELPEPPEFPQ